MSAESATLSVPSKSTGTSARGFTAIVKRLLDAGVDVNQRYGNALTLLIWAAGHANDVPEKDGVATVELILARGAQLDAADDRGRTALMTAAEQGHGAVVRRLVFRKRSWTDWLRPRRWQPPIRWRNC